MRTGLPVGRGSGRVLPLPRLGTARGQRSCPPPAPRRLENSSSFPQGLGQLRPPAGPAHTPPDRRRLPFDRGERDRLPAVPFGSVIVSGGTGNRFRAESVIFFSGIRTCWNRRAELVPAHPTSRSASRACPPCPPPACPPARACPLSVMFRRRFLRSVLDCEAGGRLRWRVTTRRAWGGCAGVPRRVGPGAAALACQGAGLPSRSASLARSPSCFAGDSCEACWIAGACWLAGAGVPRHGPALALRFACPLSIMFRRRFLRSVLDRTHDQGRSGGRRRKGDEVYFKEPPQVYLGGTTR